MTVPIARTCASEDASCCCEEFAVRIGGEASSRLSYVGLTPFWKDCGH